MKPSNRCEISAVLDTIPELSVMQKSLKAIDNIDPQFQILRERFDTETRYTPVPVALQCGAYVSGGQTWKQNAEFGIHHDEEEIVKYAASLILAESSGLGHVRNIVAGRYAAALRMYSFLQLNVSIEPGTRPIKMDPEKLLSDQEVREVIDQIPSKGLTPTFSEIVAYIKDENTRMNDEMATSYRSDVDSQDRARDNAATFSKLLYGYGYTSTDAHLFEQETDTGLVASHHGRLLGVTAVRRESTYQAGTLVKESGWDLGFSVRKLLFNCLNEPDTYQDEVVAITDPGFAIELGEEKLQKQLDLIDADFAIMRRPDLQYDLNRLGEILFRTHNGGTVPIRKIAQMAISIASRSPLAVTSDAISQLLTTGFGSSAYEMSAQTRYVESVKTGDIEPADLRTRHTVKGNVSHVELQACKRPHRIFMGLAQPPNKYDPIHVPQLAYVDMSCVTRVTRLL